MNELLYEFRKISLRNAFAKTPSERKKAEEDMKKFEKKHPIFTDELYCKARTEY